MVVCEDVFIFGMETREKFFFFAGCEAGYEAKGFWSPLELLPRSGRLYVGVCVCVCDSGGEWVRLAWMGLVVGWQASRCIERG